MIKKPMSFTMNQDPEKTMKGITVRLSAFPLEEYLSSEQFSRFCREHDLGDAWKEYLELSEDRPELYGKAVKENAFVKFLLHIFHGRPGEFPRLFTLLLSGFSREISRELPVNDLKKDVHLLGYSRKEIDHAFSNLRENVKDHRSSPDHSHCRTR
jgi:hypothetical protein